MGALAWHLAAVGLGLSALYSGLGMHFGMTGRQSYTAASCLHRSVNLFHNSSLTCLVLQPYSKETTGECIRNHMWHMRQQTREGAARLA
mgnify:CR=1 FL=1